MTNDQKQVLKAVGTLVLIKAAIYGTIAYSAHALRKANAKIDPDSTFHGFAIVRGTTTVGSHSTFKKK